MPQNGPLPSYDDLFAELTFRHGDESRSVYSPAAYLADLIQLVAALDGDGNSNAVTARRPDIAQVPLDAEHTYAELPYLDIVNEVLERAVRQDGTTDAYKILGGARYPAVLPFSLRHERVRRYLHHLGVDAAELYKLFAENVDPDVVAREYLGLSSDEVALVTTVLADGPELRACFQLGSREPYGELESTERFRRAMMLSAAEVRELLYQGTGVTERAEAKAFFIHQGGAVVTLDDDEQRLQYGGSGGVPSTWFERVNRFVRLARRTGLSLTDLDIVLRSLCGNRIDSAALRTVAIVRYLTRGLQLPVDVVVSLAAPMNTLGAGVEAAPQDLFDRVFNVPFAAAERTFIRSGDRNVPEAYAGLTELACTGDLLAARNRDYRRRLAAALTVNEADLTAIVERFRNPDDSGPFDRGIGPDGLSLLHRIARLASGLGLSVAELLDVLDAVDRDPAIQRYAAFPLLIDPGVTLDRVDTALLGGDVAAALWLAQTLLGAAAWLRESGLTGRDLLDIMGGESRRVDKSDKPDPALLSVLKRLRDDFDRVGLSPDSFVAAGLSDRAAQVIHSVVAETGGIVSARDDRVVLAPPGRGAAAAAYRAVTEMAVIEPADFLDLGLEERTTDRIFAGLVSTGYLAADGTLMPKRLPQTPDGLRLTGDFDRQRDDLFTLIAGYCAEAAEADRPVDLYPSDLSPFETLTAVQQAQMYENLVYNGYLDRDGRVIAPEFFADPDNAEDFIVDADLGNIADEVLDLLREHSARFGRDKVPLDPAVLAEVGAGLDETALLDTLRFNGHLDADDNYIEPVGLLGLPVNAFGLALEFYPHRRRILEALQAQLREARDRTLRMTPNDFRDIADMAVAQRLIDRLEGVVLLDGRVPADGLAFFADPGNTLAIEGFTDSENDTIFDRVVAILDEQRPYRLDLDALAELGFDTERRTQLVAHLIGTGLLTPELTVPEDQLDYFATATNCLDFSLPGLADFNKDIFFLLYAVATQLKAATARITGVLADLTARQRTAVFAILQDALGVPAATAEAICAAVTGGAGAAVEQLAVPALAEPGPAVTDVGLHRAFRRIMGFARLASRLGLNADEVAIAFRDQQLADKFAEPLALPPGVDRIDALLERADGTVLLFRHRQYWTYPAPTQPPAAPKPAPLTNLSAHLAGLATVDAAFIDGDGAEWIVGRDDGGAGLTFVRAKDSGRWALRAQQWGSVANSFTAPAAIDAAFVDRDGRTYLFCGDQYVRYTGTGHERADEGYPRPIGQWWENEQHAATLPAPFRRSLDAAFLGLDGRTYLFAKDRFLAIGPGPARDGDFRGDQPIAETWALVRNAFTGADHVDAGYAAYFEQFLIVDNQVVGYSDGIENDGVRVEPGYPRRIETHLPAVPAAFRRGIEASFMDNAGVLHLFKDGQTVALGSDANYPGITIAAVPTRDRWGRLSPALPSGTVDAAFVGLDGRTYLFSGGTYLVYSGTDYSVVDSGYPRGIAGDWGGLRSVDAAVVLDGATYLFGAPGKLFDAPVEHAAALDEGRTPRALRQLCADHGITVAEDSQVTGQRPEWRVGADRLALVLTYVDERTDPDTRVTVPAHLEVHADAEDAAQVHVRYSTHDYTAPDPGYPRPVSENWWNLPDDLVTGDGLFARVDAVLTGYDQRTYLFRGDRYVVSDNKRRWWSRPMSLAEDWDSLPFKHVDAAFIGSDGKTYLFSGPQYVRYTDPRWSRVDDRYPAQVAAFWGNVVNNLARTGRVDAALVAGEHTYLFSGDQYLRYTGMRYDTADLGYPKRLADLAHEPRLRNLRAGLDGVDAAFADRRNVYLFRGRTCHVVSDTTYRRYADLPDAVTCAFMEDGAVLAGRADGWHRYSSLEGTSVIATPVRPRSLRAVPEEFRTGLDAVLHGTDGNTYLFKGASCFNAQLNRAYPFAEEWGRTRNAIDQRNRIDAAFAGTDGKTYVFSGDQFVVYPAAEYAGAYVETPPRPIAEHWGGLRAVALAFVRRGVTYLFEPPEPDGTVRYVTYSGPDYRRPDQGSPVVTDASFWAVPNQYRPSGMTLPDAVLSEGDTTLLLVGGVCLQRNESTSAWSYPRPLERIWRGIGAGTAAAGRTLTVTAAFTGRDGATYFFFPGEYTRYSDGVFAPREPIRDRWGLTRNNFLASDGRVDAAVVLRGVTFMFSGDQYVRYSGGDYQFADAGYPRAIAGHLRQEETFGNLPAAFDDELAERAATGVRTLVDGVVGNDRTAYLFVGDACHAVSWTVTAELDLGLLGRVRNAVAERQRVDAALVTGEYTYLFSGDQYVRYTGRDYDRVDDGYPRTLDSLASDLGVGELPVPFHDRIDAAFRDAGGRTYLFSGDQYARAENGLVSTAPIAGAWGVVSSAFQPGAPLDAAYVAPAGELYAFRGGQYVRYRAGAFDTAEPGYPRPIKDDWGALPLAFEQGIDGAFVLGGRTYLSRGPEYVRLPADGSPFAEQPLPQLFRHRWSDSADYRLTDVRAICRFAALARAHPVEGGLAAFLLPGPAIYADPYGLLGTLFGWDVEEVRWCRRHSRFLSDAPADEDRFEIEFLLELADLFAFSGRLGAGPSQLRADVWVRLHTGGTASDVDAPGAALYGLLARRTDPAAWSVLSRTIHDELNEARRDALVAAVIGRSTEPAFRSARDLLDWFLIDVEMGSRGTTSRVREAIAAVQLYVHRYLLNLEAGPDAEDAAAVRERIRSWWSWMRGYRLWEANRKVFLYPENYLRPELRATRTPAFRALDSDLLQSEISPATVEKAYKRYLDEYTEVSRLTIAGGYVYTKDMLPDGPRRLVLFGRTKTDPRRYYFRRAEFGDSQKPTAAWEPWQPVNLQIDADQVHPVHAFGRVFVFWADASDTLPDDPGSTTVVVADDRQVSGQQTKTQRVGIRYSFYNLNKEWVPVQTLGTGPKEAGTISGITLLVRPRVKDDTGRTSVAVSCSYTVTAPDTGTDEPPEKHRAAVLFDLNPELYADDLLDADDPSGLTAAGVAVMTDIETSNAAAATAGQVSWIFVDRVDPVGIVRFDHPTGADGLSWFSVDYKGGSFLCRPTLSPGPSGVTKPLLRNSDRLPQKAPVNAAVELFGGTRFFFDNTAHTFTAAATGASPGDPSGIGWRWGRRPTVLPADALVGGVLTGVDAVLVRGEQTFVLFGGKYVRFTGTPFRLIDQGYPKDLAANTENLPQWTKVDAAFTGRDGLEYFISRSLGKVAVGDPVKRSLEISDLKDHWTKKIDGIADVDAVLVTSNATFVISGTKFVKFSHSALKDGKYDKPDFAAKPISEDTDGLPKAGQIDAAVRTSQATYFFDNAAGRYTAISGNDRRTYPIVNTQSKIADEKAVDAAWVGGQHLYLTRETEYVRYTLAGDSVPDVIDEGYPKGLPRKVDTAFARNGVVYLFSDTGYARMAADAEPNSMPSPRLTSAAWAELPRASAPPFDAALDSKDNLFLFLGSDYVTYPKTGDVWQPYERSALPFELIRLTTGTASELNRRLLSGGVSALLDLSTQEIDEVRVSIRTDPGTVVVREEMVDKTRLPAGTHLDFGSANGLYYWEIFFHAPMLVAQALNEAQRFEQARQWYEYVFDPTNPESYWRFLPFLSIDLGALADTVSADLGELGGRRGVVQLGEALTPVLNDLRTLAPAALQNRAPFTRDEATALERLTSATTQRNIELALQNMPAKLTDAQRAAVDGLRERAAIIADLGQQFARLGDRDGLLKAYYENPFDPFAIADVRPIAYRRTVVMNYIDNLLDWADMLFRQYTPESIDEARMLYILAYDLLGERSELGPRPRPAVESFQRLEDAPGDLDLVGYLTAGGTLLESGGAVHAGVAVGYFEIPDNAALAEYRSRVVDRLRKIRQSLNILGISQPLPLFEPPLDPMALVRSVAAGMSPEAAAAAVTATPPAYRFGVVFRRAQDLVDKVRQFASQLTDAFDRRDAEELSLLQNRQEAAILGLTREIKQAQIRVAEEQVAELTDAQTAAQQRAGHYQGLINAGMSALEQAQIGLMATGATAHFASSVLKIASSIAAALPQIKAGPFILGVESGGDQAGSSLSEAAEISESLAEGFSMAGEVLGIKAQYERGAEDWALQLQTAQNDIVQIGHQMIGANHQLAIARREAETLELEIANNQAVADFMRTKFGTAELYGWMAGQLSRLYIEAYDMAHETAMQAQRAFQFERGVPEAQADFIRPSYWDSRRAGLLAAETLCLDLERLGKAYYDTDTRGLEITKQVSLLELDPLAFLQFRRSGSCEFTLTEAEFDHDFPGHYCRQLRTLTVSFLDADRQPLWVNATLTQLTHKTVLQADTRAVQHLLDPKGPPPDSVRADWRPSQEIALSQVDGDNNGLFELRYDDDRYLPFERTGAVSTWRLQRSGRLTSHPNDVVITVKYTARGGGTVFANAVRGMLRPYAAALFIDVAREFPDEWTAFLNEDTRELKLPLTPDLFPGMGSRQIGAIFPTYDVTDGNTARLTLNGNQNVTLNDATLQETPGLTIGADPSSPLTFVVDGDKQALHNVGLVLTYQAQV